LQVTDELLKAQQAAYAVQGVDEEVSRYAQLSDIPLNLTIALDSDFSRLP
jgi:hypothetical protein